MEQKFEQERHFYRHNNAEFAEKYLGKTIAIKDNQVVGLVDSEDERTALQDSSEVHVIDVTPDEPIYRFGVYVSDERPVIPCSKNTH